LMANTPSRTTEHNLIGALYPTRSGAPRDAEWSAIAWRVTPCCRNVPSVDPLALDAFETMESMASWMGTMERPRKMWRSAALSTAEVAVGTAW